MKKLILSLLTCASCASFNVLAQDSQLDTFSFEEVPEKTEAKAPYFGVGGGFIASFGMFKYDDANLYFQRALGNSVAKIDGNVLMTGAQGLVSVPLISNLRIGFTSLGGSKESSAKIADTNLYAQYSIGFNGLNVDYCFTPFKSLAIIPSLYFGWGNLTLEASRSLNQGDWALNNTIVAGNEMNRIRNSFIFLQPNLNIEYALTTFTVLRLNVGYNTSFMSDEWKLNGAATIKNVPSSLNANAVSAQIGIFVGLFNY